MSILPHESIPILKNIVMDSMLEFSSSQGWRFASLGEDTGGAWLCIEKNGYQMTLRGQLGYAWLCQENISSDMAV